MQINLDSLLDIILFNIIPKTYINVKKGNKIFGGSILDKRDLSIITIGLNNEIKNPLLHGEISTINKFFEEHNNLDPKKYIFLSTHEPCSLCLSAITWAGFDNIYYFFPYSDTKEKFSIPHDLDIMFEVFNVKKGNYNYENSYWKSFSIINEISKQSIINNNILQSKIKKIYKEYNFLSIQYQKNKINNQIPLN